MNSITFLIVMLVISLIFYTAGFAYPIECIVAPFILVKMIKISKKFRLNSKKH